MAWGGHWSIDCSRVIAENLRKIQREANQQGRGKEALEAIEQILDRLQTNPVEFGEPLYALPSLRMQIRQVVVRPLAVSFGVCQDQPLVYLKGVWLLGVGS